MIVRERIALVVAELGEATACLLAERALRAAADASNAEGSSGSPSRLFFELASEALSAAARARARVSAHESQVSDFRNQSTIPAPRATSSSSRPSSGRSDEGSDDEAGRLSDFDGARVSVLEAMAGLSSPDQRLLLSRLLAEME